MMDGQVGNGILIGELLAEKYPDKKKFWGTWLTDGSLVLLYATRGTGKTFFALNMTHALATGREFLKFKPDRPRRVIYFDGEMGREPLNRRFWQIENAVTESVIGDMVKVVTYEDFKNEQMPSISEIPDQKIYDQLSKDFDVIVIDNLLTCSRPREKFDDDVKQWGRIQPWLIKVRGSGKAVVLIHHAGKAKTQLGTSIKENTVDTIIGLKTPDLRTCPDGLEMEMHFEKNRHFEYPDSESLFLRYARDEYQLNKWSWSRLEEVKTGLALKLKRDGVSVMQISREIGLSYVQTKQVLRDAPTPWTNEEPNEDLF